MIEITAKLLNGSVYLSGEAIECAITFSHIAQPEHKISQSHNDVLENLAWASAQIHCFYSTKDRSEPTNPGNFQRIGSFGNNRTSLQNSNGNLGQIILQTNPKIIFCDLTIQIGETKSFIYKERLPMESPPSYRGLGAKFSYKITVATQRVNSAIKLIRIPLRVLSVSAITNMPDVSALCCNETTEELQPANPFLEERKVETPLDIALKVLQNITARRSPNFYMITNARGKVARFCLFKSAYKLGEDIVGTFDFSVGTVKCMQVSVALQSEEEIKNKDSQNVSDTAIKPITFARHHEVTIGLSRSQLILPIPLHITPAFETDLVSLKWKLHFEFVTSTCQNLDIPPDVSDWNAPLDVPIETMVWNLPVKIYPTIPKQIPHFCQSSNVCSLVIK
ncbi:RAB6A-GEF complex partner protein 2 [Arctopsyche grandis]|uniref:RAB6A-GEF complex partner protein 2 n=1 Tax=Arctopsyche grandis TaxID=121162 RepID=UPI00406DA24F